MHKVFFTSDRARKTLSRIEDTRSKLYAHSFSFILNYMYSDFNFYDFCDFAIKHNLNGICLHINEGAAEYNNNIGLNDLSDAEASKARAYLKDHNLKINLEVSDTSIETITKAVIASKKIEAKIIRVYIREGGNLLDIIKKGTEDLKKIAQIAEDNDLHFVVEQHEDLKSTELVNIIKEVNSPRIELLFDFGNMINANEQPLDALKVMSSYIRYVHICDLKVEKDGAGYKQVGVAQGTGDMPSIELLAELMLLGEDQPQIHTYALEQQDGFVSPAYRFEGEPDNPFIPHHPPSKTEIDSGVPIEDILLKERSLAIDQVTYVRGLLDEIEMQARAYLVKQ